MKRILSVVLLCAVLLSGCAGPALAAEQPPLPAADADSVPAETAPRKRDPNRIVARVGEAELTNGELDLWYWGEVELYCRNEAAPAPDLSASLEAQSCPLLEEGGSWQEYFLKRTLSRWHTVQALLLHSRETPLALEEAYKGDQALLDEYMGEMPAARLLYGYNQYYSPNSQHQRYLDGLSEKLEGTLLDMALELNYAYMYFTTLSYDLESVETEGSGGPVVSFRHILLKKQTNTTLSECLTQANELLEQWKKKQSEETFAQLASRNSQDPGSAPQGGLYRDASRDQLPEELAQWCFDADRQTGDTTVIPTDHGVYILYFLSRGTDDDRAVRQRSQGQAQGELLEQIRKQYSLWADHDGIVLTRTPEKVSFEDLLYPDIAHERFPEVPLYLQQNYPDTMYGNYKITTNGCGITTLAMIASYLADEELTPPEMCARYGAYSHKTGTDGNLFEVAPPQLGFYLVKKTYDWREARDYMQEGHTVVVCQYRGYWTGGGHYLVLEKLTEDGLVQVRDSNLYNYRKLPLHREDAFPWYTINEAGQGYWIFQKKAVSCDACTRCGNPEDLDVTVVADYLCENCEAAQLRRASFLAIGG